MRRIAAIAATVFMIAGGAQAQVLGTLQGYVTDEQGGVLPGVSVTVINTETGAERVIVTDSIGFYIAPSLTSGMYSINAELAGMQRSQRDNIRLFVAQVLNVDFNLRVGSMTEELTVTSESPIVEVSSNATSHYVSQEEIAELPIIGRNYVDFALLAPTAKREPVRGGISMSGQKGISSGLNIDGMEAKSAFFGYGRGGEATENDGIVIAQDSVKEFQVVASGYSAEIGAHGGGYINVITKSGTNKMHGTLFGLFRNESMIADKHQTPLDDSRGNTPDLAQDEFKRLTFGASLGGPIVKDKTHFFVALDKIQRDTPFIDNIAQAGVYDAVLLRAPGLVDGYTRNADGTAFGNFLSKVDNLVLFGRIDHQLNANNSVSLRYNYTDYEIVSDAKDRESLKAEKTHSFVASVVSIIGDSTVNEFRYQFSKDDLQRDANLDAGDPSALLRISTSQGTANIGKPDFLPITVNEKKHQFRDTLTMNKGNHEIKVGFDFQKDDLVEFFAGSADGRYDYRSVADFLADNTRRVRIWFGPITEPNAIVPQDYVGIFAQDSWKPNSKLTINYGLRWQGTFNVRDIPAFFEEARNIPNDTNNWGPRFGFAYTPDDAGKSVIRGGVGLFHQRTPTLVHVDMVQSNGLCPPNCGRVTVSPGDIGFVPFGEEIDKRQPAGGPHPRRRLPAGRLRGTRRRGGPTWDTSAKSHPTGRPTWTSSTPTRPICRATTTSTPSRRCSTRRGRYIYPDGRPDTRFQQIKSVADIGWSNYYAVSFGIQKRFTDGFQLNAHYTWSQDKDTDSNERSATGLTITNGLDPGFDYGFSERDINAPLRLQRPRRAAPGIPAQRNPHAAVGSAVHGSPRRLWQQLLESSGLRRRGSGGGPVVRASSWSATRSATTASRTSTCASPKFFQINDVRLDLFAEVFNAFDQENFSLGTGTFTGIGGALQLRNGDSNPEFGLASNRWPSRQFQARRSRPVLAGLHEVRRTKGASLGGPFLLAPPLPHRGRGLG